MQSEVSILRQDVSGCADYGYSQLVGALEKKGVKAKSVNHWTQAGGPVLVVGTTANRRIQILLENAGVDWKQPAESTILKRCRQQDTELLVVAGSDGNGLMYNLLELARRVEHRGAPALLEAEDLLETPYNPVRCVDRYVVGHLDDEWLKSEEYWHYLLQRMAAARFNRFCLIVGFDTAYMAPPYPFFVPVEKYPQVRVKNLDAKGMAENLAALRTIGRLCHQYGMKFDFATWQQRPWTDVQDQMVENLPEETAQLGDYCYEGLKALVTAVPEIDIVQFRVNHESGVGDQVSAADFWNHCTDAIADIREATGRPLVLDLRAKGLTDAMVDHAYERGLDVEVPTKYWCEHAALPYHLSVMRSEELAQIGNFNHSRRYSYGDMLRKPKYYDVIFRLWNYGSTNLFLWGDADYARRFSKSCRIGGSTGFQINTPLSLKYGHELSHKEPWRTFAKPELECGKWEDERFWMWYTVYGRLGYNPDADCAVWRDEFVSRFGEKAAPCLEQALAAASKIVPLITTAHMPVHPSLRYWPELNTGWSLFYENNINTPKHYDWQHNITYGSTLPSDEGLFYGIEEYVKDFVAGTLKGKYSPLQVAQWFDDMAAEALQALAAAKKAGATAGSELAAMEVDLQMLCDLGRYHAEKTRAATALALFKETGTKAYLGDAAILLDKAIAYWDSLSSRGKENYYHDLDFSSAGSEQRRGTWGDLSCELERDRETLAQLCTKEGVTGPEELSACYAPARQPVERWQMAAKLPACAAPGKPLAICMNTATFGEPQAAPVLHYRHLDQTQGHFLTAVMERTATGYAATIPADYITPDWDIQVYITVQDASGACAMLPGVYHPSYPYPYHIVKITEGIGG